MDKKILLAVDDSLQSKAAVKYAVAISSAVKNLDYVLFHVQPMISHYLLDEARTSPQARAELDKVNKKNDASARKILEQYQNNMVRMGIDEDRIDQFYPLALKMFKDVGLSESQIDVQTLEGRRRPGKVIIEIAEKGNFGTVVIGRRGINKAFFTGSVSHYVINKASACALWVVS